MKFKKTNRRGATVVEFALVAPFFFFVVIGCIDFSRFWMAESIVENTVFQTARHVSVFGGTFEEARDFAAGELALLGIEDFELEINTTGRDGSRAMLIDDDTMEIEVEIRVPPTELSLMSRFFSNIPLVRNARTVTNRP